jgi:hypothetical protein
MFGMRGMLKTNAEGLDIVKTDGLAESLSLMRENIDNVF